MKNAKSHVVAPFAALLLFVFPVFAHHSFTTEYDFRKPVLLHGTVAKFDMINPHGWISLDVKSEDGMPVRWMIELSNPNFLERAGWKKDSLKLGDETTVDAYQAKDGSHTANANLVTLPDGRQVAGGAPVAPHDEVPGSQVAHAKYGLRFEMRMVQENNS